MTRLSDGIKSMGGLDGFLREQKLSSGVEDSCDELQRLIVGFESSGFFSLENYNEVKLVICKISTSAASMASRIRRLESASTTPDCVGSGV